MVIVSYNDPQGNHRFVTPVRLSSPTENLAPHSGKMRHGDAEVEIITQTPFDPEQANTTTLIAQAPVGTRLVDAHLFLEFINPEGTVVREEATTVTLEPGPNVVDITWNPADFNPAYDPEQDYIVMAFFTDWQGNILDTAAEICNKLGNCEDAVARMKHAIELQPDKKYFKEFSPSSPNVITAL